jgi:hypothetical protein
MVGNVLLELQQTPRSVTISPPSEVTSPPAVAELTEIAETAEAVRVGMVFGVSFLQLNNTVRINPVTAIAKIEEEALIVSSLVPPNI